MGICPIITTYSPPNTPSTILYAPEFHAILQHKFAAGRYIRPFSQKELKNLIGPFQTSPLTIILKPGKPGKFRLVQNFSYPRTPAHGVSSISSSINSDHFPCTWGTFTVVCLLISRLPPGSQAAVRDVKEVYRTIPTHPDQWPGMVIWLSNDSDLFALDMRDSFGLASGGGCYGVVADAGTDIVRAWGIGPISKWVDDHIFFRILKHFREEYNARRAAWAADIRKMVGVSMMEESYGTGAHSCPMTVQKSLTRICPAASLITLPHPPGMYIFPHRHATATDGNNSAHTKSTIS